MKLFRGDWDTIITYNIILLVIVITTGQAEFLYLLLLNVFLIAIQIYIKYEKDKENIKKTYKQETNYSSGPTLRQEDIEKLKKKFENISLDFTLTEEDKERGLLNKYIEYCVLKRMFILVCDDKNDLDELSKFKQYIINNPDKSFMINNEKLEYLTEVEKNLDIKCLCSYRENYYRHQLNTIYLKLRKLPLFKEHHDYLFNIEEITNNEISNYIQTGIFNNFSKEFDQEIKQIFQTDKNLIDCYYHNLDYIYDNLWHELYVNNNIKDLSNIYNILYPKRKQ